MKRLAILAILGASALSACATAGPPPPPAPVAALRGSAPTVGAHPMQAGITCLRQDIDQYPTPIRFAVSTIKDDTGKVSYEASQGGTAVSQGATLMAMSALSALGPNVRQVVRNDTRIPEWELSAAQNGFLKNGATELAPRGVFEGSEYFISGSVTEVNWNWSSGGFEAEFGGIGLKKRSFVMDVAVDLYLARTSDLSMVGEVASIRKQIVGKVDEAGVYSFLGGDYLADLRAGTTQQEPIQYGLRAAVELAILELAPRAFGTDFSRCREYAEAHFAY